jgi:hypothetical protein
VILSKHRVKTLYRGHQNNKSTLMSYAALAFSDAAKQLQERHYE